MKFLQSFKFNVSGYIAIALFWMLTGLAIIFNTKSLPGYDAYYNAQIAKLMSTGDWIITDFTWTPFSIWSESFFDKEWLFHLYLVPFVSSFGKIQGMLMATLIAIFFIAISWAILLKCVGVKKHIFLAMIFILFSSGYLFLGRIILGRSILFSLIFLPLIISCAIRKKTLFIVVLTYLYTLSYVGAVQVIPIILLFDIFEFKFERENGSSTLASRLLIKESWKENLSKMILPWVILGFFMGLIINPYFPTNINGIYVQIILVLKANWFGVGGGKVLQATELSGIGIKRIFWHLPLIIFFIFTSRAMWINRTVSDIRRNIGSLFVLSVLYLIMTVFSQRFIEYLAPFSSLFILLYWTQFPLKKIGKYNLSESFYHKFRVGAIIILIGFGAYSTYLLNQNFYRDHLFYNSSSKWLAKNVEPNSIIFTGDWDMNTVLFCNAPQFRYFVMLDPYFMYAYSSEKYFKWLKICEGKVTNPSITIINEFGTTVVFVPHDRPKFLRKLELDEYAHLAFKGESGESIFTLQVPQKELDNFRNINKWLKAGRGNDE